MNGFTIGFIMMTAAAIVGVIMTVRGWRTISRLSDELETAKKSLAFHKHSAEWWSNSCYQLMDTLKGKALVRDNTDWKQYEIYHVGDNGREVCAATYSYNPDDPDDKEYIRIHAEEVAEKLNERV